MIDYGAPFYVYWLLLFPLTIVGIIACVLVVYAWCGKRYKFNRLIIMTLAATHAVFLVLILLSTNMEEGEPKQLIKKLTFTVRLYAITLYVFLAATQYVVTRVLHKGSRLPAMASKKRIIGGLVLIAVWCTLERVLTFMILDRVKDTGYQFRVASSSFHVFTLVLPQMQQVVFVCGMALSIRRYRRWLASGELQRVIVKSHLLEIANRIGTSMTSVRRSVRKFMARCPASTAGSHRINPEEARGGGQMLPVGIYRQRADYVERELLVTKAVTILCTPPIFIFTVGFSIGIDIRLNRRDLRDTFFWVMDLLQFINCICTFVVLAAVLPVFRRALRRRLLRLCRTDMTDLSSASVNSVLTARSCPQRPNSSGSDHSEEEDSEDSETIHTSDMQGGGDQRAHTRRTRSGNKSRSGDTSTSGKSTSGISSSCKSTSGKSTSGISSSCKSINGKSSSGTRQAVATSQGAEEQDREQNITQQRQTATEETRQHVQTLPET